MNHYRKAVKAAIAATLFGLLLSCGTALAEPFSFQGFVESGNSPIDGTANLRFRVYTAANHGDQLGNEVVANNHPVADGVFNIDLDFGPNLNFDGSPRFLEVEVNSQVMDPRFAILPTPLASSANALRGRSISSAAPSPGQALVWNGTDWVPQTVSSGGGSYTAGTGLDLTGSVFSVTPSYRLPQGCSNNQVAKWNGSTWACAADANTTYSAGAGLTLSGTSFSVNFSGSGAASTAARADHNHFGQTWSGSGAHGLTVETDGSFAALRGFNNHTGSSPSIGIDGAAEDSSAGIGVRGTGNLYGVQGRAAISTAAGVYGLNNFANGLGAGVEGVASGAEGTGVLGRHMANSGFGFGVDGLSQSANGIGVRGTSTSADGGIGVAGTSSSPFGYGVAGANNAGSGTGAGVRGSSLSSEGIGVLGLGNGAGVRGESSSSTGAGIRGIAEAASGTTAGVHGSAASPDGSGVLGQGTRGVRGEGTIYGVEGVSANVGVSGLATAPSGQAIGVEAASASPEGAGVFAMNSANSGDAYGVYAQTNSTSGAALVGDALAGSGNNRGVLARTASGAGIALRAENTGSAGLARAIEAINTSSGGTTATFRANGTGASWAIEAISAGATGRAIHAVLNNASSTGVGIYAQTNSASARAGQFSNLAGGEAARFDGSVNVVGTLSKSGGTFKIDHPLDPENKFLYHSFVESPDMMNIYNGNIVTDRDGFATVELPDWFDALNRDFRYQLTVIGSFAQAIIAEEVEDNRFVIQTNAPEVRVSWQVTGVRQDPWAEANRIQVEVAKGPAERGRFLHPEAWGQPRELAIGFGDADDTRE